MQILLGIYPITCQDKVAQEIVDSVITLSARKFTFSLLLSKKKKKEEREATYGCVKMGVEIVKKEIGKKETVKMLICIGKARGCGGSPHQGEIKHIMNKQEH